MKKLIPSLWNPFLLEDDWTELQNSNLSLWEDQNYISVEASVPGMNLEEIEVSCHNGILWIKAEKREEEKEPNKKWYRKASQVYSYRIAIPGNVDEKSEPEASLRNGVLEVKFKKIEQQKPKKIKIKES
jgi:HSP20 family protein